MSVFTDRAVLPRRAVIAGAAAALVSPPAVAKATAGNPAYAAKRKAVVAAWAKLNDIYAEQKRHLAALGNAPTLPERLREPMQLPQKTDPTAAPEDGWSAHTLSELARTGMSLTAQTTPSATGATMRTEWKPVNAKTRKQAAELLPIREAHDAECGAWWDKVHAIEETSLEPLETAIGLALDLMSHPVSTVAEVRDKLALMQELDLLNLTDEENTLWEALIRDALAAADSTA